MYKFKDNWPAPTPYLIELGRMTSVWGSLESTVTVAISKLAGYEAIVDYRAIIMTAHSTFQQRIDVVGALCEQLAPEYPNLRDYKAVISKVRVAQTARNKFAHNALTANEETNQVEIARATARGSLKTTVEKVVPEDISEATAKIHDAMCALHTLVTGRELKPMWERDE